MDAPPPDDNQLRRQHNGGLRLGTTFTVDLGGLLRGELRYSGQDLRRAMDQNSALSTLIINFSTYGPTAQQADQDFVQFLLRFIASRNHLVKLKLKTASSLSVVRQFIVAAVQSETIQHLRLVAGLSFRIYAVLPFALADFCRANRNIKVLEIEGVHFNSNDAAALAWQGQEDLSQLASMHTLDRLVLNSIRFHGRPAANTFLELAPYLKCSHLELGEMSLRFSAGDDLIPRIASSLVNSLVRRLTLRRNCSFDTFRAALTTGKAVLEELFVDVSDQDSKPKQKYDLLEKTMPDKLKVFHLHIGLSLPREAKARLFRTVDACATLTEIQVMDDTGDNFNEQEMEMLREGRTERNNELHHFVETPPGNMYPERDLLKLMLQLENCPTGLYKLARKLPSAGFFPNKKV